MDKELSTILQNKFPNIHQTELSSKESPVYEVNNEGLLELVSYLKSDSQLYFDVLSCISGIDQGKDMPELSVRYDLYSITKGLKIALVVRVKTDKKNALSTAIPSLCGQFKTANWLEREVYDLYGIYFENHPDLRRILLPADWIGYPLRKSYSSSEKYHGLIIEHEDVVKKVSENDDKR